MESFGCSRSLSKCSGSRITSSSRLTANMAAAMLSFRLSPPENTAEDDADSNDQIPEEGTSFRNLSYKKSVNKDQRNNNDDPQVYYEPVTIPGFHEVQTGWPGFSHEPVPNWQEKYMIAKPYPRNEEEISRKASYMNYGTDLTFLKSSDAHVGLRNAKSKSKSHVTGTTKQSKDKNNMKNNKPKRIIYLERVGSCLK